MHSYPIQLIVKDRRCLVAGGGRVAARKVRGLLAVEARVTVVSPVVTDQLTDMTDNGRLEILKRRYESSDLDGMLLAFAATDDRKVNARVARDASERGILCNVADNPRQSDFTLPAVVRSGDVTLAVNTGGKSPALSRWIRRKLTSWLGPEYAAAAEILGQVRERLLSQGHDPDGHRRVFTALLENGLVEKLKDSDTDAVRQLLDSVTEAGAEGETGMSIIRGLDE